MNIEKRKNMEKTVTISVKTLQELISISEEYLEDEHQSETNKSYFNGKREAYQFILDNYNY